MCVFKARRAQIKAEAGRLMATNCAATKTGQEIIKYKTNDTCESIVLQKNVMAIF